MIVLRIIFVALFALIAFVALMFLCSSIYVLLKKVVSKSEKIIDSTDEEATKKVNKSK